MAEDPDKDSSVLATLTDHEKKILARAVKELERDLLDRTYKSIEKWLLVAIGVISIGGLVSFVGIKDAIVLKSAELLSQDEKLRTQISDQVTSKAESKLKSVSEAVARAEELRKKTETASDAVEDAIRTIEKEKTRVVSDFEIQAQGLADMLKQLSSDLQNSPRWRDQPK